MCCSQQVQWRGPDSRMFGMENDYLSYGGLKIGIELVVSELR